MATSSKNVGSEVYFAQRLAGNEKSIRDRALKKIRKWFEARSQSKKNFFTEDDMLKIWKGLHYCMWMCDKLLVQEELADKLAGLVHSLKTLDASLLYIKIFFKTIAREWFIIDRLRLDKFMMLVRRILNQSFQLVKRHDWTPDIIDKLLDILREDIVSPGNTAPDGVKYHVADIYLDELTKVGSEDLDENRAIHFLLPYCELIAMSENESLVKYCSKQIFEAVIVNSADDDDDVSEENEDKDSDNNRDKATESKLKFNYEDIADYLFELASGSNCLQRNRTIIYGLVKQFKDIAAGVYTHREESDSESDVSLTQEDLKYAMKRLKKFETGIKQQEEKERGARRKRKTNESIQAEDRSELPRKKKKQAISFESSTARSTTNVKTAKKKSKEKAKNTNKFEKTEDIKAIAIKEKKNSILDTNESFVKKDNVKRKKTNSLLIPALNGYSKNKASNKNIDILTKKTTTKKKPIAMKNNLLEETKSRYKQNTRKKMKENSKIIVSGKQPVLLKDNSTEVKKEKPKKKIKKDKENRGQVDEINEALYLNTDMNRKSTLQEDVEIWIPNKKYKGNLKGPTDLINTPQQMKSRPHKKENMKRSAFATFQSDFKTPPAFVRKAVAKVIPKSEPRKLKQVTSSAQPQQPDSAPPLKKRVSFGSNSVESFKLGSSITLTPEVFHPKKKPDSGILKTPPKSAGKMKNRKRSSAADFFSQN